MKSPRRRRLSIAALAFLLVLMMLAVRDRAVRSVAESADESLAAAEVAVPETPLSFAGEASAPLLGTELEASTAALCEQLPAWDRSSAEDELGTQEDDRGVALERSALSERLLVSRDAEHLAAAAILAERAADGVAHITEALTAMQIAASSVETRAYWPETIELLERALAAAGGYSFAERASFAFAMAAANLPRYSPSINMCEEQSAVSSIWAEACLRYGELAERQGRIEVGQSIARAIQISVLEILGDRVAAEVVIARREEAARVRPGSAADPAADLLVATSPTHFSAYLTAVREHGESAAWALMQREAERLNVAECWNAR